MKTQALVALLSAVVVRGFDITTPSRYGTLKAGETKKIDYGLSDYHSKCKSLYGDASWASFNTVKVSSSNNAKIKVDGVSDYFIRKTSDGAQTMHLFSTNRTSEGVSYFDCNIECDTVGDGGDCDYEFYYGLGCQKSDCCYLSHDKSAIHPEKYIFCDNPLDERNATGSQTSDGIEVSSCPKVDIDHGYNYANEFNGKIKRTTPPYDQKCPSKDSCEYRCAESYDLKAVADNMVYGVSTIHDCACDDFLVKVNGREPFFGKIGKDMNKMSMTRNSNDLSIEIHSWNGDTECPTVYKWSSSSSHVLYSMISLLLATILSFSI